MGDCQIFGHEGLELIKEQISLGGSFTLQLLQATPHAD